MKTRLPLLLILLSLLCLGQSTPPVTIPVSEVIRNLGNLADSLQANSDINYGTANRVPEGAQIFFARAEAFSAAAESVRNEMRRLGWTDERSQDKFSP